MEIITPTLLVLVPVVIGVVEVCKRVGINSRYAPALSIILGIVGAVAISGFSSTIVIGGIIVGLMASGLYSGTKATLQ